MKIPIIGSNHFMLKKFTALLHSGNLKKDWKLFMKWFSKVFNEANLVTTPSEIRVRLIRPRLKVKAINSSIGISLKILTSPKIHVR